MDAVEPQFRCFSSGFANSVAEADDEKRENRIINFHGEFNFQITAYSTLFHHRVLSFAVLDGMWDDVTVTVTHISEASTRLPFVCMP